MHSLSTAVTSSLIVKSTQAPNSLQACNARREQWRHRASGAELRSEQPQTDGCTPQSQLTRRQQLAALGPLLLPSFPTYGAAAAAATDDGRPLPSDSRSLPSAGPLSTPDFTREGPFQPIKLPQLEHTCTSCDAPADRCRLKIHAWVPKGGGRVGKLVMHAISSHHLGLTRRRKTYMMGRTLG